MKATLAFCMIFLNIPAVILVVGSQDASVNTGAAKVIGLLLPALVCGYLLGKRFVHLGEGRLYRPFVYSLVTLAGVTAVFHSLV